MAFSGRRDFVSLVNFFRYLPGLLCNSPPIFKQVRLSADLPEAYTKGRCCGPHCQCSSRFSADHKAVVKHTFHPGCRRRECPWSLCKTTISVPVWVGYSYNFATPASHDKLLPRHQQANLPPAGVSKRGAFRHHMNSGSRCMMPSAIYSDCKHVLSGLASAFSFLRLLRKELDAMLGPVGVNNSMLRMQECMAKCWDWKHLLTSDPAAQHEASFMWPGLE